MNLYFLELMIGLVVITQLSRSIGIAPPENWVKLNTNGSSIGNPGLAGGEGLIRNANGEWVRGFARAIGVTTSAVAELWALRDGIHFYITL